MSNVDLKELFLALFKGEEGVVGIHMNRREPFSESVRFR